MSNQTISGKSDLVTIKPGSYSAIMPTKEYGRYCVIMGGHNVSATGDNTWILSATPRKFDTSDTGKLYLRADNGVMIETSPGVFINASELLAELQEYRQMLKDLYYAPPYGPGYLKSLESFSVQKEACQEDVEEEDVEEEDVEEKVEEIAQDPSKSIDTFVCATDPS